LEQNMYELLIGNWKVNQFSSNSKNYRSSWIEINLIIIKQLNNYLGENVKTIGWFQFQ
jgi:hypothetical protein